jgi:DNA repair protein RadC
MMQRVNKCNAYNNDPLQLLESEPVRIFKVPCFRVQLVKDGSFTSTSDPCSVTNPGSVYNMVKDDLSNIDREYFLCLMLNTKNKVIGLNTVSIGSLSASIVHPREVFKPAIIAGAASIILIHNHPSGDPSPSQEDLEVTRRLHDAGNLLGINVRDHLVIGDNCFFSFKEKGLL